MNVLILTDGMNGVVYHRLYAPHLRMQLDNLAEINVCQSQEEWLTLDYKPFDVIVFSRWLGKLHYDVLKRIADAGKPYVMDVDDYWVIPKYNPAYWAYRKGIKTAIKDAIHYADAVTCTTKELAKEVKSINEKVYIVPNCLDLTHNQWSQPKEINKKIKIGWVGGLTHEEDLKLVADDLNSLDVEFYLCGYTPSEHWNNIAKLVPKANIVEGTTVWEYGEVYKHFDFVIAPLQNTHFNNCKSELKILEAAAYKIPIICSGVLPYTYHIANDGVVFANNNWKASIEKLIDVGHSVRQSMGQSNYDYCETYHKLELHNLTRLSVYQKVCK
jgi:glycosyltransferase involved in cell wall biosynthesis